MITTLPINVRRHWRKVIKRISPFNSRPIGTSLTQMTAVVDVAINSPLYHIETSVRSHQVTSGIRKIHSYPVSANICTGLGRAISPPDMET